MKPSIVIPLLLLVGGLRLGAGEADDPFKVQKLVGITKDESATNSVALLQDTHFDATGPNGWRLLSEAGGIGQLELDTVMTGGKTNAHALRLVVVNPMGRCGVRYEPGAGLSVKSGDWYDLEFEARTEKRENDRGYGLTVSLESQDGTRVFARTTLPEVGGDWKVYSVALHARTVDAKARLVITMSEPGTIWLDNVSLSARKQDGDQKNHR